MPTPPTTVKYKLNVSLIDKSLRQSRYTANVAAADFTAWQADTTTGLVRALIDSVMALTEDVKTAESIDNFGNIFATPPPTSEGAINGNKLLVIFRDNVNGKRFSVYIPARKVGSYISVNNVVTLVGAPALMVPAYVTAANAVQRSAYGNLATVQQIRVVDRRWRRI